MGEASGFPVMRLARLSFAGITAEGLRPGAWQVPHAGRADGAEEGVRRSEADRRRRDAADGAHASPQARVEAGGGRASSPVHRAALAGWRRGARGGAVRGAQGGVRGGASRGGAGRRRSGATADVARRRLAAVRGGAGDRAVSARSGATDGGAVARSSALRVAGRTRRRVEGSPRVAGRTRRHVGGALRVAGRTRRHPSRALRGSRATAGARRADADTK